MLPTIDRVDGVDDPWQKIERGSWWARSIASPLFTSSTAAVGEAMRSTHLAQRRGMSDIRFQSLEDGDLADIWYALGGAAARHPDHFQRLMDECFRELVARREESLKPWLEERFRPFRLTDSREDAAVNVRISPEARS